MENVRRNLLIASFVVIIVVAIIIIYSGAKGENQIKEEEIVGIKDIEYTGEIIQTLDMTLYKFYDSIVGFAEETGSVNENNEQVVKYDVIIKYDGRLLQGIVEEVFSNNEKEIQLEDRIEFKVYAEYRKMPELYEFGKKIYSSFNTGKLDKNIKILYAVDEENKFSIYKYKDKYFYVLLDEYKYNNKEYEGMKILDTVPEEYKEQVEKRTNEIIDMAGQ